MLKDKIDLIGQTPVVELKNLTQENQGRVYLKLEGRNLGGSVKSRAVLSMIKGAEVSGKLKKGMTIIEPTSGNTGIAIALIGKMVGYPVIIVMPDTMSEERRKIIQSYGAELILTDGAKGMKGAIDKVESMLEDTQYYYPNQFENEDNWKAHYHGTAQEIIDDFGRIDAFVAGVGTGGTITGVGKRLKEESKGQINIVGVEPTESSVMSNKEPGKHGIQGIGAGFIPGVLQVSVIDEIITVSTEEAYEMTRKLLNEEGLLVGISTGANVVASLKVASTLDNTQRVVTISPDDGEKYISTGVFK